MYYHLCIEDSVMLSFYRKNLDAVPIYCWYCSPIIKRHVAIKNTASKTSLSLSRMCNVSFMSWATEQLQWNHCYAQSLRCESMISPVSAKLQVYLSSWLRFLYKLDPKLERFQLKLVSVIEISTTTLVGSHKFFCTHGFHGSNQRIHPPECCTKLHLKKSLFSFISDGDDDNFTLFHFRPSDTKLFY